MSANDMPHCHWTTAREQSIREDLEWMGWKPVETTYSSDSFQVLYDMAIKLIEVRLFFFGHIAKSFTRCLLFGCCWCSPRCGGLAIFAELQGAAVFVFVRNTKTKTAPTLNLNARRFPTTRHTNQPQAKTREFMYK